MGLLPLWSAIPGMLRQPAPALGLLLVLVGTAPFTAVLGYLTPMLVDRWSGGDPDRAGSAYAVSGEETFGSLRVGQSFDVTVFDRDPRLDAREWLETEVTATVVGGRLRR